MLYRHGLNTGSEGGVSIEGRGRGCDGRGGRWLAPSVAEATDGGPQYDEGLSQAGKQCDHEARPPPAQTAWPAAAEPADGDCNNDNDDTGIVFLTQNRDYLSPHSFNLN